MDEKIRCFVENGIATVILNDPEKMNALSQPMATELNQTLTELRYDKGVKVVVLRGANGTFCAGGDVKSMKKRVDAYVKGTEAESNVTRNMWNLNALVLAVREMPQPVVAWIEGACTGGGLSLAMACDFSFAAQGAKMACAFIGVGLAPDMGSSLMVTMRAGVAKATDLFMMGRRFSAEEAETWGLITRCVPAEELETAVQKQVQALLKGPGLAYAEVKAAINDAAYGPLYQRMGKETAAADRLARSGDHAEAVNAFLEKRAPVFTGK